MATFRSTQPLNFVWRPSGPDYGQAVAIRGQALGEPLAPGDLGVVPDALAVHFNLDMRSRIAGFEWVEVPDTEDLDAQLQRLRAHAPDVNRVLAISDEDPLGPVS